MSETASGLLSCVGESVDNISVLAIIGGCQNVPVKQLFGGRVMGQPIDRQCHGWSDLTHVVVLGRNRARSSSGIASPCRNRRAPKAAKPAWRLFPSREYVATNGIRACGDMRLDFDPRPWRVSVGKLGDDDDEGIFGQSATLSGCHRRSGLLKASGARLAGGGNPSRPSLHRCEISTSRTAMPATQHEAAVLLQLLVRQRLSVYLPDRGQQEP